jgi:hypothetical protein
MIMPKKLLAGIAPMLAIVAFAVVPAVAQAEPHWYQKKTLLPVAPTTVATAGTLILNALGATTSCNVSDAEEIWNPVGGGAGQDLTTAFNLSKCKVKVGSAACPKGAITVLAEGLPWPSRLFTEPPATIRDEITKVRLNIGCVGSSGTAGDVFEGSLTPQVGKSKLVFGGPGGGTLLDIGANPMTVSGNDNFVSPKGILAKDP